MINKLKSVFRGFRDKIVPDLKPSLGPMPALYEIDRKLSKYLNYHNGFFIEAGANNGYTQSNTYYLEMKKGWTGILVEPIPELYEECKKQRNHSYVYNYALVSKDYPDKYINIHFANLMSVVEGALKTHEAQSQHLELGVKIQKLANIYSISVPARTLESLLDELPQPLTIDFFSLDVEGYELQVLQGLNLEKYKPHYILVEARFFEEVNAMLEKSYEMIDQLAQYDYLYELKSARE